MERPDNKIKLLVADDHSLFRKGLVSLLADYEDFDQILEAADGEELLKMLAKGTPDVVLLDLKMPKLSGITAMPILNSRFPEVKVLVLTMHAEPSVITSLMRDGANGYLLKDAEIEEVVEAIRTVHAGNNFTNKLVSEVLQEQNDPKVISGRVIEMGVELTKHEELLLKLIVEQYTSAEIALKMSLGKRTIETYRRILMNKIGVKNTAGLVAFALQHKLVLK